MKRLIAFDLDDTLAITKSPIDPSMAEVLGLLLEEYELCIISGGKFEQFQAQVIGVLQVRPELLQKLHIMPTCGTRYYRYEDASWVMKYAEDLDKDQKTRIISVLEETARDLGYWEENPTGDIIEDRGSQITYSALGQKATPADKYAWDPEGIKKQAIRVKAAALLPGLEVRAGGSTSIDVTREGIDKAYGMKKLLEATGLSKDDVVFYGDKLEEGGNDYPVKAFGIDSIAVDGWQDTLRHLKLILATV